MSKPSVDGRATEMFSSREMGHDDFHYLCAAIASIAGIKLSESKKPLVMSRLRERVQALGFSGIPEYRRFLETLAPEHPEWQEFTNSLTTNKTDWFREPGHFDFLMKEFLPRWGQVSKGRPLSVWSAACSTGEEPYTIAMLLEEARKKRTLGSYHIHASDIDTSVLRRAAKGVFLKSALEQIPHPYQESSFISGTEEISHLVKVRPELKKNISFRQLNLTQPPFPWSGELDVIFCRNVFIYFSKDTILAALEAMYRSAAKDAVLFVGHSESLQGASQWRYVGPSVYVKGSLF